MSSNEPDAAPPVPARSRIPMLALGGLLVVAASWMTWLGLRPWIAAPTVDVQQPPVRVHVVPIDRRTLYSSVDAYGRVRAEPSRPDRPNAAASLAAPTPALVEEVRCTQGEAVSAGQTLFVLDSRVDDARIGKLRDALAYAKTALEREQTLLAQANSSPQRVEASAQAVRAARGDLDLARARRSLTRVTAPIDGTVVRIGAQVGAAVDPTTVLAELVDLDRLVLEARVPSQQVGGIQVGDPVDLGLEAIDPHSSRVELVSPTIDPLTDTVSVLVSVPPGTLRNGAFVRARILADTHTDVLAVPETAVVDGEQGPGVHLISGRQALRVPVTTAFRDHGWVEISAPGLDAGMEVVSTDAYGLPDALVVEPIESSR